MKGARWFAVAVAAVSVAFGVVESLDLPTKASRHPGWAQVVNPVAEAPLSPGIRVALVTPVSLSEEQAVRVFYEVVWLRPELRWARLTRWPVDAPPDAIVTVASEPPPRSLVRVWASGQVAVFRPVPP